MSLKKGQHKPPEKQLNELETGNLPEKEFRIMVKMIQDLREDARKVYQRPTRTNKQTNR